MKNSTTLLNTHTGSLPVKKAMNSMRDRHGHGWTSAMSSQIRTFSVLVIFTLASISEARRYEDDYRITQTEVDKHRSSPSSPTRDFEYPGWASKCRLSGAFDGEVLLSCVQLTRCRFVARQFIDAYFGRERRDVRRREFLDQLVCGMGPGLEPRVCCPVYAEGSSTTSLQGRDRYLYEIRRFPSSSASGSTRFSRYRTTRERAVGFSGGGSLFPLANAPSVAHGSNALAVRDPRLSQYGGDGFERLPPRRDLASGIFGLPTRFQTNHVPAANFIQSNAIGPPLSPSLSSSQLMGIEARSACGQSSISVRIAGGTGSIAGEWPWAAAIGRRDLRNPSRVKWGCGGALITSRHILTAAHCLPLDDDGNNLDTTRLRAYVVRLGDVNILEDDEDDGFATQNFRVVRGVKHPNYQKRPSFWNDVAVLELDRPAAFTQFVSPVCLPEQNEDSSIQGEMIAIGWGGDGINKESVVDHLQSVALPIIKFDTCVQKYEEFDIPLRPAQFCAGVENRDTCRGDSGAPTMQFNSFRQAYEVVGITSIGSTKCGTGIPGVYTRVEAFSDWIIAVVSRDF